jgi:type II secretory pathway pseudopilin PulG
MRNTRGVTVVELTVLLSIVILFAVISIPKLMIATDVKRTEKAVRGLKKLYDAQYIYHRTNGHFSSSIAELPLAKKALDSSWFSFAIPYVAKDTFYVEARVHKPYAKLTNADWLGISSNNIASLSNPVTLGRYSAEWRRKAREGKRNANE